jgi:flagellar biosynthesis protein FlhB
MPDEYKEDKTEKATPKKRNKARSEGSVAQSQEVGTVAILTCGTLGIYFFGSSIVRYLMRTMLHFFSESASADVNPAWLSYTLSHIISGTLLTLAPFLLILILTTFAVSYLQIGFLLTAKGMKPKLSAIKPSLKKLNFFSKEKLITLGISIGKLTVIGLVTYMTIKKELPGFIPLMDQTVGHLWLFICKLAFRIIMKACMIMVLLAIIDYIYKRWKYEDDMKMTKQEVKDERKMQEGNPEVKGAIRGKQREFAMQRMMTDVPAADVVITNPTTYAVAVKYNPEGMAAPKVVAKGARLVADRIKEIARMHDIPIIENKPLAQALFKVVDVGYFIPLSFYKAVAEILAHVYRLKGKSKV